MKPGQAMKRSEGFVFFSHGDLELRLKPMSGNVPLNVKAFILLVFQICIRVRAS